MKQLKYDSDAAAATTGAASMPPELRKRTRLIKNNRHIPPEIIEEILLNLPVKSLVRFSSVSKAWSSMIFGSKFIRNHKIRAGLLRRQRIVINLDHANTASFCDISSISLQIGAVVNEPHNAGNSSSSCAISSMFSEQPVFANAEFLRQLEGIPCLYAFCDELWCVGVESSVFLWNPSMRNSRKLPNPLFPLRYGESEYMSRLMRFEFVYGFGYDSVNDDYKILKIPGRDSDCAETELYSMKSNSWREIHSSPLKPSHSPDRCVFADGKFHWLCLSATGTRIVVSFDLSTEKYGEVVQPEYSPALNLDEKDLLEMFVLKGMLCACVHYRRDRRFVLWMMENYGVEKSWTKKFDIDYSNWINLCLSAKYRAEPVLTLRPLYLYDNDDGILIKVCTAFDPLEIFMYKKEEEMPTKIVNCRRCFNTSDAFLYVESLISPAALLAVGNNV